jgi:phosphatidylglycerol---prolipoprotein diacylglyceryl transferase
MDSILWRWGAFSLYWYTALVGLGVLAAAAYVLWCGQREGFDPRQVLDGMLWALVGGLIGARAAYVIPNWGDYSGSPGAILSDWGGGLVFQGGLVLGALALVGYALFAGLPCLRMADLAVRGVCLAQAFGWLGAHVQGANYGLVIRSAISMWLPDLYGVYGPRFPTQAMAALLAALLFLLLHWLSGRSMRSGWLTLLFLAINGGGHFALEFTRADDAILSWGIVRGTQVAEMAQVIVAAGGWLYLRFRQASASEA